MKSGPECQYYYFFPVQHSLLKFPLGFWVRWAWLHRGSSAYQLCDLNKFTVTFLSLSFLIWKMGTWEFTPHWAKLTSCTWNETMSGKLLAYCLAHIRFSKTGNWVRNIMNPNGILFTEAFISKFLGRIGLFMCVC